VRNAGFEFNIIKAKHIFEKTLKNSLTLRISYLLQLGVIEH